MSDDKKVVRLNTKFKNNSFLASTMDVKTAATSTIALILFIMAGVNFSLFQDVKIDAHNEQVKRGIASVPKVMVPQWRKNLGQINSAMIAEVAKKPSAVENLGFGDLEGRYSLDVQDGIVKQIQFSQQGEPKRLEDHTDFLFRHASAFGEGVSEVERVSIRAVKNGRFETYRLVSESGESFVELHLDSKGRLLSAEVK